MAYSQGGLIQAADYNGFLGTTAASAAAINSIWSTGNGDCGYGQTALGTVSQAGLVTATQWASAVNTLNSIKTHQSGSGTGIGAPTTGTLISYLSTFSSSLSTAYTNRRNFATQGTTTTGSNNATALSAANGVAAQTLTLTRTATFSSGDAARYFFNAGGQINFVISSTTNTNATARSADLVTLASTNFVSYVGFRARTAVGVSGTGGTVNTNLTAFGYYDLTTSFLTFCKITGTSTPYAGDYVQLDIKSNGVQGSNADVGTILTFQLTLFSAAQTTFPAPPALPSYTPAGTAPTNNTTTNDAIDIVVNNRLDIVYPETTNLSTASWGTVTIG
jgi:hypothetical protein